MVVVGFGIIESILKIKQNSILERDAILLANLSNSSDQSELAGKVADGMEQETLFDNFGIAYENDINSYFVMFLALFIAYLLLYYSVCQALFILLMLTVKQTGNEFRKRLKTEGYQDDENGISGLSKVSHYINLK